MAKKLSILDSSWLSMESRDTPMHVGGLVLFEMPEDAGPDYMQDVYKHLTACEDICPPFNQKLKSTLPMDLDAGWVEDRKFDIEYHVRHAALPKPGRIRELLALVSRIHGQQMDRQRPLWESYLIEGIEGNRFALFTKMHHSLVDGVAAMKLMQSRMSHSAEEIMPAPWSAEWLKITPPKKRRKRDRAKSAAKSAMPAALSSMGKSVKELVDLYRTPGEANAMAPYQAPRTILNSRITGARRFAAQSWDMQRIRDVAAAHNGTINDVVLAMCSGCLREYLMSYDALPEQPLVANVPVSIRPADAGDDGGNAITLVQVSLATHIGNPIDRMRAIQESMRAAKERLSRMNHQELLAFTTLANLPFTLGQVGNLGGRLPPMFNVVISNVPGPREPLYMHGAKMQANYPASLCFHGYALNITLTSYLDSLDFGFTACRNTLPKVQRMLDYLENSIRDLEQGGKTTRKTVKKPAAKKAAPKKTATKAAAKKTTTTKTTANKTTARKTTAKKTTPQKTASKKNNG